MQVIALPLERRHSPRARSALQVRRENHVSKQETYLEDIILRLVLRTALNAQRPRSPLGDPKAGRVGAAAEHD